MCPTSTTEVEPLSDHGAPPRARRIAAAHVALPRASRHFSARETVVDASILNPPSHIQATGVAMANATYEFMRANATEEMRRVLGAKAANVQLAVPPTLAAGDWSVDSEGDGEGSSGDLHDGVSESDNNN